MHANGDVIEGTFFDDKVNGFAKFLQVMGMTYEGDWKDDMPHGKGKKTDEDGSTYEGEFTEGRKHGYGEFMSNKTNALYKGYWDNN